MSGHGTTVRISVVTPTHNRPDSLLRLLRALRDGIFPTSDIEAVVVADGCNDDTVARVRAEPLPFSVRVVEQNPGRGAAAARNLGATLATGGLLVFLDDDIEPFPALLAEHWREFEQSTGPTAVVGPPRPVRLPNAGLHAIAVWAWWEQQFARMQQPGHRFTYDNVFSGNLSLPRELFSSVGGFDVEFNSCRDDSEFGLRILRSGGRVAFATAAAAWHHELRDASALNRRKQAEGIADVRLARLYPELWPVLNLALPDRLRSRALSAVQRLAFAAPRLGDVAARGLQRFLPPLETLRMRGAWRRLHAGLMYYWYWVGVARALGNLQALAALRSQGLTRAAETQGADLNIDLAQGLAAAEEALDAAQPAGATIRWGPIAVGRIAPHPGAEPLGGRHLRAALATDLAQPLTSAFAAAATTGAPVLRSSHGLAVSVVIPAFNAGETLGETLDSLLQQTSPRWEAIVVDDGSTDDTADVAMRFARRDSRIRLLRQANAGEGAARNAGVASALFDWVLFLDADDWLLPNALQTLTRAAADAGTLDAVTGGWSRVATDGTVLETEYCSHTGDLFAVFARHNAIPIHAALVRRAALPSAGPFDTGLKTCADWDFWQRFARSGAKFGRVNEDVARYRMRAGSSSTVVANLWPDGLRVIEQGHSADARVPDPRHRNGAAKEELSNARFEFGCWVAGLVIGLGGEPQEVLATLANERDPGLNSEIVAEQIFRTVPLANAQSLDAWDDLWPQVLPRIAAFFSAIERQSHARLFARRAMRALERLTLDASQLPRPFVRGETYAIDVEVSQPLADLVPPPDVERAHCVVLASGVRIGTVLVPLSSDAAGNRGALAEEMTQRHAWSILGWFFQGGPYRTLALLRGPGGITVSRQHVALATGLSDSEAIDPARLHDRVGWTVFLQELWGHPDWPADWFYDAKRRDWGTETRIVEAARLTIDVSAELASLRIPPDIRSLEIDVRVGAAAIGSVSLPVTSDELRPATLRAAITLQSSFELCRAAVREGVLGRPRDDATSLRARLRARHTAADGTAPSARQFPPMPNDAKPEPPVTSRLPILMYHDVAPALGQAGTSRYCVPPNEFEAQLDYLRHAGFRGTTLTEWTAAMHYRRPLPGRAVLFTFDDAYRHFAAHAFPLLQKYGFPAIVFVPCGFVGATDRWDEGVVPQVPLLDWHELRELASLGVEFGAHSWTHSPMTGLTNAAVLREAADSKATLEREVHMPVTAFAYPHGDSDAIVQHLVASCGYTIAVTTTFGRASLTAPRMALPRIEVTGGDDLASFIAKLGA